MENTMKDLINTASDKKYTDFEAQAKEALQIKVAQALNTAGYFDRLSDAKMEVSEASEAELNEKQTYKEFMAGMLKKFGVKSPAELKDDKKKEFFDAVDAGWDGKDEKPEAGDK